MILEQWLFENQHNPYPTIQVKEVLAKKANLTVTQVTYWMANSRKNIEAKCSKQNKISTENKIKLLDHFSQNQDPGKKDIEKISKKTGLDEKRIKAWFRRQRYNQRQIKL